MNIKEMYENELYKEIVGYYERTHDLDDVKYVALLCKELKNLKILQLFYNEHHKAYDDDELVCHAPAVIYQIVSEMQSFLARVYHG